MSVRYSGFGLSVSWCLCVSLQGCAVSAIRGEDDANLSLTRGSEDAGVADDGAFPDPPDASPVNEPDASPQITDAGSMPPTDAGTTPAPVDAGSEAPDAEVETLPLTLDGIVQDQEWANATWVSQTTPSNWGTTKNVLLSLGVTMQDGSLWLAVRGQVENTNALVVYFDSTPDMGLAPSDLTDQTGALDDALSAALNTQASFGAELAWGTRSMGVSATSGFNASTGFRGLVDASAANLSWIDGSIAPTVCSMNACEARIPLTYLGAGTSLSLFARITSATGATFSNQTLPADVPENPMNVSELLTLSR